MTTKEKLIFAAAALIAFGFYCVAAWVAFKIAVVLFLHK